MCMTDRMIMENRRAVGFAQHPSQCMSGLAKRFSTVIIIIMIERGLQGLHHLPISHRVLVNDIKQARNDLQIPGILPKFTIKPAQTDAMEGILCTHTPIGLFAQIRGTLWNIQQHGIAPGLNIQAEGAIVVTQTRHSTLALQADPSIHWLNALDRSSILGEDQSLALPPGNAGIPA